MSPAHAPFLAALAILSLPLTSWAGGWSVDLAPVSVSLGHAWPAGPSRSAGVEAGLGIELLDFMLAGEANRAGAGIGGGDRLAEMVHLALFTRKETERSSVDVGLRLAAYLRLSEEAADFPGGGGFVGAYAQPMWGGRTFQMGPRLDVGFFNEDGAEFGVLLMPLSARFRF